MWAWLAACGAEPGRGVQDGEPVACLAVPDGAELPADGTISGLATADSADLDAAWTHGDRCDERARVLELTNDDGAWRLGYGWKESNLDATHPMPVGPEQAITLRFAADGAASGFVLRDAGVTLLAALEVGTEAPALPEGAVEGLSVTNGDVVGSERAECGRLVSRQLAFDAGGEPLTLEPVDQSRLVVEGRDLEVWALTNTAISDPSCPLDGRKAWALWTWDG